jgi:hypothetical protein
MLESQNNMRRVYNSRKKREYNIISFDESINNVYGEVSICGSFN